MTEQERWVRILKKFYDNNTQEHLVNLKLIKSDISLLRLLARQTGLDFVTVGLTLKDMLDRSECDDLDSELKIWDQRRMHGPIQVGTEIHYELAKTALNTFAAKRQKV